MVRLMSLCYLNAKLQNFLQFSKDFLQKMFIFLAFLLVSIKIITQVSQALLAQSRKGQGARGKRIDDKRRKRRDEAA